MREHMILAARISSMLALAVAAVVLVTAALRWGRDDPRLVPNAPTAMGRFKDICRESAQASNPTPPLVAQAEALALYLTPPKPPEEPPAVTSETQGPPPAPVERLRVHATSYYPDRPDESLALISISGSPSADRLWVKQGTPCGAVVIDEVRRGAVVYRAGDERYEATIDRRDASPGIAAHVPASPRRVSTALANALRNLSLPPDPNRIESNGN